MSGKSFLTSFLDAPRCAEAKGAVGMPETRHIPGVCEVANGELLRQGGRKALGKLNDVVVEEARICI